MNKIKELYKEVITIMRKPVMSVLPGHLSFFLLLSSIPIMLMLGLIASALSVSFDKIKELVRLGLPAGASKIVLPLINGKTLNINIIVLIISAVYLVSRATKAIIMAANNVYGVQRKSIQDIIKSVFITILLIILFIFIIIILILGGRILEYLSLIPGIGSLNMIEFLRWPISVLVIFAVIKLVYTLTPNKKINSKTVNKGSLFTSVLLIVFTYIYSFYITHYASYNDYYGSASNFVVLMLWLYLVSQIFVIGMIINSIEDKKSK